MGKTPKDYEQDDNKITIHAQVFDKDFDQVSATAKNTVIDNNDEVDDLIGYDDKKKKK